MNPTWTHFFEWFKRFAILIVLLYLIIQLYDEGRMRAEISALKTEISILKIKAGTPKELDDCHECCHKIFGYVHEIINNQLIFARENRNCVEIYNKIQELYKKTEQRENMITDTMKKHGVRIDLVHAKRVRSNP